MGELRVENLVKTYQLKEGWNTARTLRVFDKICFAVHEGEFVSIIGPSGCGKSTLLNLAAGLDEASGGVVYVDGRKISGPGLDRGVVFQEFALMPWLTIAGNVEFGLRSKGVPAADRRSRAQRHIDLVGLSGFEAFYPYRLSGGMRQRVGIARALAIEPSVLLMDEPFGSLDAQTRETMQKTLGDIWQAMRTTVLFITHDIREAIYLSDRVLVMTGRPATISLELNIDLSRPRNRHDIKFQEYEERLEQAIGHTAS
jgi:ABC-type nitrate/sulfonate/bicarbonate transport system ATPase subunit